MTEGRGYESLVEERPPTVPDVCIKGLRAGLPEPDRHRVQASHLVKPEQTKVALKEVVAIIAN